MTMKTKMIVVGCAAVMCLERIAVGFTYLLSH
jgi:hypothetical protein